MANTYSQIFVQVVFAVRDRENLIDSRWKEHLFQYITGILKNKGQKLIAIGGVADHIHILLSIGPNINLSDLVRDIKANSARFINERKLVRGRFSWQEGFGAFSYSRSQLDDVAKYVLNQEKHHSDRTFKSEYTSLLKNFNIEYDERYLFDWIE